MWSGKLEEPGGSSNTDAPSRSEPALSAKPGSPPGERRPILLFIPVRLKDVSHGRAVCNTMRGFTRSSRLASVSVRRGDSDEPAAVVQHRAAAELLDQVRCNEEALVDPVS